MIIQLDIYYKIVIVLVLSIYVVYFVFDTKYCVTYGTIDGIRHEIIISLITDDLDYNWVKFSIKLLYSFNIVFTYPLCLYPVHTIIDNILFLTWPKNKKRI